MPKRVLFGLLATFMILFTGFAQAGLIPVGDSTKLDMFGRSDTGLTYRLQVGDIQTLDVKTDEGDFTQLILPGFQASRVEGAPELPMMNTLIALPLGGSARVTAHNVVTRVVKLADLGIDDLIIPAQPSMPKNAGPADRPFVWDRTAYAVDKVERPLASIVPQGRLRDIDYARLEFSPVSYRPADGELEIVESAEFDVIYEGGDLAAGRKLYNTTYSPFFENLYDQLDGAKGLHDSYPDHMDGPVTMVIITPSIYEAQLADFIQWKTERGFNMVVGVIGSAEVGSTTSTIQSYIQDLYDNATTAAPAPTFVLFVGDVADCPTYSVSGDATDRPYCTMDGDYVPDIYYGRFSATNSSELQAMIDKTMMYEQYTMSDPSYLDEVTLIAGADSGYAPTHGNGQINYGTDNYFNAAHGLTANVWLYPASSGSVESAIVQTVSDGVSFINYTAHGSATSWYDPAFSQSNVNSLTNSEKYCLAVGNCCETGTYNYSECFAETWLRAADKGAIGYIGASNSTYWDEDFWWGAGSCPSGAIDGDIAYAETEMGAYDGLFHENGEALDQWYVTNGALVFSGNLAVQEAGSSRTEYYWNIYNLQGDPSLSTYIGVPDANTISIDALGSTSLTVSADVGSYIGLTQGSTLIGSAYVGSTGTAVVDFLVAPDSDQDLHMVVTAQNRQPYVEDLAMASPDIDLSVTTCSSTLEPDATDTDVLRITNTGEANSQLDFDIIYQAEDPSAKAAKNVSGSTVSCGVSEFLAGETLALDISVYNASNDAEWLTDVSITVPAGVTVNSATSLTGGSEPLDYLGATGDGVTAAWQGYDGSYGALQGSETATATLNVTFGSSLTGTQTFSWTVTGDVWGSTPHSLSGTFTMTASGPSVTVTYPDGGETLAWGMDHTVTWDHDGDLSTVKIDLSRDGGSNWENLVASTANDGSETVTLAGPSTDEALIRVSSLDETVQDVSDTAFTLYESVDWLSLDVTSGSLAQNAYQDVTLTYDATGMTEGTYTAYVLVDHNCGVSPEVVTVTMIVESETGADSPRVLTLRGNYPNPFNPATEIAFSMPRTGHATLEVVDVRGHLVRTLRDGTLAAGDHAVAWDGTDGAGRTVASGVYFARLRAEGTSMTHKMVLAK